MPPFLNARQSEIKILAKDERLNPLNKTNFNYVFVDISLNIPDKVNIEQKKMFFKLKFSVYVNISEKNGIS